MNVVVTGGAGYLGSVLVRKLLDRGYRVRVIDPLLDGDASLAAVTGHLELVRAEAGSIQPPWLRGADALVHLAGMAEDSVRLADPAANWRANVAATLRLAIVCRQSGVRRFTYASTCEVYASSRGAKAALREWHEETPVQPHAPYAASKLAAEQGLKALCDGRFCPVSLRHGVAYGASPRPQFGSLPNSFVLEAVSRGVVSLPSDVWTTRPFVDVEDLAEAHIRCLEAPEIQVRGQCFDVVGANLSLAQAASIVAGAVARVCGPVSLIPSEASLRARDCRGCPDKLEAMLDFAPRRSLEQAATEMARELTRVVPVPATQVPGAGCRVLGPARHAAPGTRHLKNPERSSGSYSCWVEGA
jgi:nucleoside-diphosphate-sugar epimerase